MNLPPIARVSQNPPRPRVIDIAAEVRRQLAGSRFLERVKPGASVAIGVGSRGIGKIAEVVRSLVDELKRQGYRPFIVAAMGSHGGASAEGQREILAGYGVSPESMGVEVRTEMDTEVVGTSPIGLPIYFDRNAYRADALIVVNRVKPHTDFRGEIESGLIKMMVIGLGKRQGAEQVHKLGLRGMTEVMPAVGRILVEKTPLALGLAILENSYEEPAEIVAVEPERFFEVEPGLLQRARGLMGRLPMDQIDALIVGELGKNYSGAGLDPNVIGRLLIETAADFDRPRITRIGVLDLSPESHGNGVGIGLADLTTERLAAALDPEPMRINTFTASFLERARVPISLPTDLDVLQAAVSTCWRSDPADVRLVLIPNTLELQTLWISPALEAECRSLDRLSIDGPFGPIPFLPDGSLDQSRLFPESHQAHRSRARAHQALPH